MTNYLDKAERTLAEARETANQIKDKGAKVNALATVANCYRQLWEAQQSALRVARETGEES